MTAKILAFTPTFGDAMRDETVDSVTAAIEQFGGTVHHEVSRHNPHGAGDWRNVAAQFQRARELCLAGEYDALWTVEHDMIVPPHALRTLYDDDAPVVYGVYLFRHKSYTISAFRYDNDRNVGMSLMQYPQELEQARRAKRWEVSGVGFGCTLMRRDILERIPMRGGTEPDRYPDLPFARDCIQNHIVQVARFDVPCLHWCADMQMWLDPYRHMVGTLVKVSVLQDVNLNASGQTVRLEAGTEAELPADVARDAERAGFVAIIASAAELKAQQEADDEPDKVEKRTPRKRRSSKAK